jgi:hypothetical protein
MEILRIAALQPSIKIDCITLSQLERFKSGKDAPTQEQIAALANYGLSVAIYFRELNIAHEAPELLPEGNDSESEEEH